MKISGRRFLVGVFVLSAVMLGVVHAICPLVPFWIRFLSVVGGALFFAIVVKAVCEIIIKLELPQRELM